MGYISGVSDYARRIAGLTALCSRAELDGDFDRAEVFQQAIDSLKAQQERREKGEGDE